MRPVVMAPLAPADVPELLGRLDGSVLSGGVDLAPAAYDAHPTSSSGRQSLISMPYATAREAVRLGLTILGICCGAQALNVARGGPAF